MGRTGGCTPKKRPSSQASGLCQSGPELGDRERCVGTMEMGCLDDDFRGKTNILWCANSFQIDLEGLQELKHFVKIL